jgi:hypothetical protein
LATCSIPIVVGHNGGVAALFCNSGSPSDLTGSINLKAWDYFAEFDSPIMRLKPNATLAQVLSAACAGPKGIGLPATMDIYSLAAGYNHWAFNLDQVQQQIGAC